MSSRLDIRNTSTTELVEVLNAIAAELTTRPAPESGGACKELTESVAGAVDQTERVLAGLIARVDASGVVKEWGFASTKAWLRTTLGMRDGRAQERLTLARHVSRLPQVDERWTAGELSFGYAATIAEAVTRLTDDDCAKAERILLDLADEGVSAGQVARVGRRIRDVIAERDGTDEPDEAKRSHDRSWMAATRSLDGGSHVQGWLNPEDSAIWHGVLDKLAKPAGPDDMRDTAERTAAALSSVLSRGHRSTKVTLIVDLQTLTSSLTPNLTPGPAGSATASAPTPGTETLPSPATAATAPASGEGPDMASEPCSNQPAGSFPDPASNATYAAAPAPTTGPSSVAPAESAAHALQSGGWGSARLADGTPISAEQARRIAMNAGISPLILGAGNHPLYLGYTVRFASPAQRRALEAIYPTCAVEHCPIPGTLCEVDHVDGWALGHSPTNIDKLALCCGWHNRWKHTHPKQMEITRDVQGRYVYRTLPPPLPWKTGRQRRTQTANRLDWNGINDAA
ncbi:DUF222 domain-containing protein [Spirillospora sp. NPDC047279]|uniref:HNH endonuclease signature motif containing protein n=1 Tax=Spirillospora sp. NPDC047279 TaxID=3155478 RepID=UPI003400510A